MRRRRLMREGNHNTFCLGFFFQAEDGIRARNVTGVQTCALPISAFTAGYLRSAAVAALVKNDIKPSLVPSLRSWKLSFLRFLSSMTFVISISLNVVSIAVFCDTSRRRLAIVCLRRDIFSRLTGFSGAASALGAAFFGSSCLLSALGAGALPWFSTSWLRTRPRGSVGLISEILLPFSRAS